MDWQHLPKSHSIELSCMDRLGSPTDRDLENCTSNITQLEENFLHSYSGADYNLKRCKFESAQSEFLLRKSSESNQAEGSVTATGLANEFATSQELERQRESLRREPNRHAQRNWQEDANKAALDCGNKNADVPIS